MTPLHLLVLDSYKLVDKTEIVHCIGENILILLIYCLVNVGRDTFTVRIKDKFSYQN